MDFGQADFIDTDGKYVRKHYLVISFPYSNVSIYEILPGENGECVCQGLLDFFEFIGGVPAVIVFDNATGHCQAACNIVQQSELFTDSGSTTALLPALRTYVQAMKKAMSRTKSAH